MRGASRWMAFVAVTLTLVIGLAVVTARTSVDMAAGSAPVSHGMTFAADDSFPSLVLVETPSERERVHAEALTCCGLDDRFNSPTRPPTRSARLATFRFMTRQTASSVIVRGHSLDRTRS